MRRSASRYIISMYRMPHSGAVSRDRSDNSAGVVSSALLKFIAETTRLGYSQAGALWLFGRLLATCSDRRRRRITRKQALRRAESLAAAVPLDTVSRRPHQTDASGGLR